MLAEYVDNYVSGFFISEIAICFSLLKMSERILKRCYELLYLQLHVKYNLLIILGFVFCGEV